MTHCAVMLSMNYEQFQDGIKTSLFRTMGMMLMKLWQNNINKILKNNVTFGVTQLTNVKKKKKDTIFIEIKYFFELL